MNNLETVLEEKEDLHIKAGALPISNEVQQMLRNPNRE